MTLKDFIGIIDSNTTCYLPSDNGRYDYKEVISFQWYIINQDMQIKRIKIIGENEVLIYLKDSE